MMKKILKLFKIIIIDSFNVNKFKINRNDDIKTNIKKILKILLVISLVGYIMGIVGMYTNLGIDYLKKYNLEYLIYVIFLVITTISVFTLSVLKSKATLFNIKDVDMLFSMPIKTSDILTVKFMSLIFVNYFYVIIIMLPTIIVYGVVLKLSYIYYLIAIFSTFFIPCIPTVLSAIFGYFIALISSKAKKKNIVETIITIAIFLLFIIASEFMQTLVEKLIQNVDKFMNIIKTVGYPIYLVYQAVIQNNSISLLMFILLNILIVLLYIYCFKNGYSKILLRLGQNTSKGNYKGKRLVKSSINKALLKKEFKTYISIPVYVINTIFGVVMLFMISIASIFYDKNTILSMMEISGNKIDITVIIAALVLFIVALTNTTSSSISLEGTKIQVIKSLPISEKQIFLSKILLNIIVALPLSIISICIMTITLKIEIYKAMILILLAILITILGSQFGIITNLLFPKLDFKSPVQVVKQGLSTFVAIMGLMAFSAIIAITYYYTYANISFNIYSCLVCILILLLIILQHYILNKWGIQKFRKVS